MKPSKEIKNTLPFKEKDPLEGYQCDGGVNHPAHYNFGNYEVIDVLEDWKLNFHLGNAVKYIARAGRKHTESGDNTLEDLKKARWYLDRYIKNLEG